MLRSLLSRFGFFALALLLAAIDWYGFSGTIEVNLFHPSFPRPFVLYLHAAVFGAWILLLVVQSGLVALARRTDWHRRLGWLGLALGCTMPVLGIQSALRMTHLRSGYGDVDAVAFLIMAYWDMACFTVLFALAMVWRKQPERHRRLILTASTLISVAALTRFPPWLPAPMTGVWAYYGYADAILGLAILRDLVVIRQVHPVFRWALPVVIAGQAVANAVYMARPDGYMRVAYWLIG